MWFSWTLAGASILLGLFYFIKSRKFKRVVYFASSSPLFVDGQDIGRLELTYNGSRVKSPVSTVVSISSTGTESVKREDFEQEFNIHLAGRVALLYAESRRTFPSGLDPNIEIQGDVVVISPLLLNSKDEIEVQIITDGQPDKVSLSARIVGVPDIRRTEWVSDPPFWALTAVAVTALSLMATTATWFPERLAIRTVSEKILLTIMLGGALFTTFVLPRLLVARYRRK